MPKRKPPKPADVPDDKQKPLYRVRGAANVRERSDWRYPLPHGEWIDRLNTVRRQIGDRQVSLLLGYAVTDPSYKSVRRLAAGQRLPDMDRFAAINSKWRDLNQKLRLVNIKDEIAVIVKGLQIKPGYQSKIMSYLLVTKPYHYRHDPPRGLPVPSPIYPRGVMMQAVDAAGAAHGESRKCIALIVMEVNDTRNNEPPEIEAYHQIRDNHPHLELMKNAIDTWLEVMDRRSVNVEYKTFDVRGVWFSYV